MEKNKKGDPIKFIESINLLHRKILFLIENITKDVGMPQITGNQIFLLQGIKDEPTPQSIAKEGYYLLSQIIFYVKNLEKLKLIKMSGESYKDSLLSLSLTEDGNDLLNKVKNSLNKEMNKFLKDNSREIREISKEIESFLPSS